MTTVQEAIQIAKREMGLAEVPPMDSEARKVFGRRVYELCVEKKDPLKISKLEEFELWKEKQGKH